MAASTGGVTPNTRRHRRRNRQYVVGDGSLRPAWLHAPEAAGKKAIRAWRITAEGVSTSTYNKLSAETEKRRAAN